MSDQQIESNIPSYLLARKPEENVAVFSKRVDHEELIASIMREVVGVSIQYTEDGQIIMTPGSNPVMNLKGARRIHTFLRMSINPITTLTQFNENQIATLFETMMDEINMFLYTEYENIEIDKSMIPIFSASFALTLFAQLNRAKDGMENKAISIQRSLEEHHIREEGRKEGFHIPFTGKKEPMPESTR